MEGFSYFTLIRLIWIGTPVLPVLPIFEIQILNPGYSGTIRTQSEHRRTRRIGIGQNAKFKFNIIRFSFITSHNNL